MEGIICDRECDMVQISVSVFWIEQGRAAINLMDGRRRAFPTPKAGSY